jgi:hypothetical protein
MDKVGPQKSQDTMVVVLYLEGVSMVEQYPVWRVQWQVFTVHPGMGSKKRDLTPVLLPCWRCYSHVGRKWLAVALNALTFVCKQVGEEGSTGSTQSIIPPRATTPPAWKQYRRAGLVQVGAQSRVPRLHTYVVLARRTCTGGALAWFFKGFCGVDSSGVCTF